MRVLQARSTPNRHYHAGECRSILFAFSTLYKQHILKLYQRYFFDSRNLVPLCHSPPEYSFVYVASSLVHRFSAVGHSAE